MCAAALAPLKPLTLQDIFNSAADRRRGSRLAPGQPDRRTGASDRRRSLRYVGLGILCLGNKETIRFTRYEDRYEALDLKEKIYRRVE